MIEESNKKDILKQEEIKIDKNQQMDVMGTVAVTRAPWNNQYRRENSQQPKKVYRGDWIYH